MTARYDELRRLVTQCSVLGCAASAPFGFGVLGGSLGRWACKAHRSIVASGDHERMPEPTPASRKHTETGTIPGGLFA